MSDDVHLGIGVDSSQVARGAVDLDRLAQAAIEAGAAVDGFTGGQQAATAESSRLQAEITRQAEMIQRLHTAQMQANDVLSRTTLQANNQTTAFRDLRFSTANVAAQFQDIAVTAQMGMNPLIIALQQGTQLSQAFIAGPGGIRGVVGLIGTAIAQVLSPVSLLTIGLVFLSAVAIEFFGKMAGGGKDAAHFMDDFNKRLEETVKGYKEAEAAIKDMKDAAKAPMEISRMGLAKAMKDAVEETEKFRGLTASTARDMSRMFPSVAADIGKITEEFSRSEIGAGELWIALQKIRDSDMGPLGFLFIPLLDQLIDGAKKARELEDAVIGIESAMAGLGHSPDLKESLDTWIDSIRDRMDAAIKLDAIYAKSPGALADIARRKEALSLADDEISETLRLQKVREAGELAYAEAAYAVSEADRQRLRAARDTIETSKTELELMGEGVRKSTEVKFVRDQIATAEKEAADTGVTVSEAYIRTIRRLGDEYGKLAEQIAEKGAVGDLLFQRSQMGRTGTEQDVADTLRSIYGDDFQSEMDGFIARQVRINDTLKEFSDMGRGAMSSFFSELKKDIGEGKSLLESFALSFASMLESISNSLLQNGTNDLWSNIFGAIVGGVTGGVSGGAFDVGGRSSSSYGFFASGTRSAPPGLAWVGERGPELMRFRGGEQVYSATESSSMGGGMTIHIDARGAQRGAAAEFRSMITDWARDEGRMFVRNAMARPYEAG